MIFSKVTFSKIIFIINRTRHKLIIIIFVYPYLPKLQNYMYDNNNKKNVSSSFSLNATKPSVTEKYGSFSVDKANTTKQKQKIEQKLIINRVIDALNQTKQMGQQINLNLLLFEQKKNIPGLKAKVQWLDTQRDMKVSIKISFNSNYFKSFNNMQENDIVVEMEELNFQLDVLEKKHTQEQIQKIFMEGIQRTRLKPFNQDETKKPMECLKYFFVEFNNQMKKGMYKNKKKVVNKIQKSLSKKTILYPSPACISWSPSGNICITQNKYPANKKSFYAQSNTLRRYFETNHQYRVHNLQDQDEQNKNVNLNKVNQAFEWQIQQQINLLIFNERDSNKAEQKYTNNEVLVKNQVQNKKQKNKKDEDYVDVANINRIQSLKLKKIYQKYFGQVQRKVQFGRQDKLKVYQMKRSKCSQQNDINYIVERLSVNSQKSKIQIIFHNQLSLYPHLSTNMDSIKYKILCKIINKNLQNPKIAYSMNLKVFVLENQYFETVITNYFRLLYRLLGKSSHYMLHHLSSYIHFDNIKAEFFFIDVLDSLISRNQTKCQKINATQLESRIKIKTKLKIPKFQFESVISESDKSIFLMNLFPLLIAKDRQKQRLEYRTIKRIITANNKIFKFIKKMNQIICKLQQGKTDFIKAIIQKYKQYSEDTLIKQMTSISSKRFFFFHCGNCNKISKIYDLVKENLEVCQKCKQII